MNSGSHAPASSPSLGGAGFAAAILMGLEAAIWLMGILFVIGLGVGGLIAAIVIVSLAALSLLTILLLEKAPRGAVWLGLPLQGVLALQGLLITVFASSLFGLVEVPLAMVTAICLAAAMPKGARD